MSDVSNDRTLPWMVTVERIDVRKPGPPRPPKIYSGCASQTDAEAMAAERTAEEAQAAEREQRPVRYVYVATLMRPMSPEELADAQPHAS